MRLRLRLPMILLPLLLLVALAVLGATVLAENIDPVNNNSQFAYGENVGWLNAEPANCGDCGVLVSDTRLSGYMWGENIGWINLSCQNNGTCAGPAPNWGVTNNGSGVLSGYAWVENVGWISFSCMNVPATCAGTGNYGVTINTSTGVFSGNAYGENIGWITFSDTAPVAYQVQSGWACSLAGIDNDGDTFLNTLECHAGTSIALFCAADIIANNEEPDARPTDFNDDRSVTGADLSAVAGVIGQLVPPALVRRDIAPDPAGDNAITGADLSRVAGAIGSSC